MSDFASNVIARALGRAPAVQPRLPSLFESSLGCGGLADSEVEVAEILTPTHTTTPSAQSAVASAHAPASVPPGGSSLLIPNRPSSGAERTSPISPAQRQSRLRPTPANMERRVVARPEPSAPRRDAIAAAEPAEPVTMGLRPAGAEQIRPSSAPLATVLSAEPRAERSASTSPAPIIRVTIGRIDVRLVAPARPLMPSVPSRKPMLSLEEYLRARNGGQA